jgi:hypothetical protein
LTPPNGMYRYSGSPVFPTDSNANANASYGVDVVFQDGGTPPPPSDGVDRSITVTGSPSTFTRGTSGSFVATVGNGGPSTTSGTLTVTDVLPAGLAYASSSGTGWTCSASGQTVTCNSTTALAAGATSTVTITTQVAPDAPATVVNTVSVTGSDADSATGNDQATVSVPVEGGPALADLTGTLTTSALRRARQGTIRLTVRNDGPQAAAGPLRATIALGAGVSYVAASGTGWSCSRSGSTITCTRPGSLAAAASAPVITVTVVVTATTSTTTTTTATVSSVTTDPDPNDNTISQTAPII